MIDPKQKAKELVAKFRAYSKPSLRSDNTFWSAKLSAILAVDEILDNFGTLTEGKQHYVAYYTIEFYEKVKTEIENL